MGQAEKILSILPFIPLAGAFVVYWICGTSKKFHALSGWLATIFSGIAFLCVAFTLVPAHYPSSSEPNLVNSEIKVTVWNWIQTGTFSANMAFLFDHLTAVMCLIITGVGSLIHLYAIGYMAEDADRPRFFSYLNLFLFSMLLLVLGDNLLVLFVGWEGVGLCSYLLIGFWFKEMDNARAGQKAFVVNRIGDAGFLLGIFILFNHTGTVTFAGLREAQHLLSPHIISLAAFCLFIGAVGKSAQIPLFVWLPDAMAGPTPVSALIHAATMVTAGVYMIARLFFLFEAAPDVLTLIAIVGSLTAFVAATIALTQNDIKKVLAYSTVSQLGYMFMAMGAGAFSNGIFHVTTHAFFKACLFMSAGSVIMGCHHEQDMRQFGGLRKYMPLTFISYLVATLAIAGFPYLAGFYSKDAILWAVLSNPEFSPELSRVIWGIGALTAFLTAFYMTRSLMMTFFGEYRGHGHPHESPWVVTVPILILGGLSAVFGFLGGDRLLNFLAPWGREDLVHLHAELVTNPELEHVYHYYEHLSMIIAVAGIVLAIVLYGGSAAVVTKIRGLFPGAYRLSINKWWFDEIYGTLIVRPLAALSQFAFSVIDRSIIDNAVDLAGIGVKVAGEAVRRAHGGRIHLYALTMVSATVIFFVFWLLAH